MYLREILFVLSIFFVHVAYSQSNLESYSNSRYTIKKNSSAFDSQVVPTQVKDELIIEQIKTPQRTILQNKTKVKKVKAAELYIQRRLPASDDDESMRVELKSKATVKEIDKNSIPMKSDIVNTTTNENVNKDQVVQEPKISEQIVNMFGPDAAKVYNFYKSKTDPDDIRNNRFEFDLKSGFVYLNSDSKYSYRRYNTNYNNISLHPSIWLSPLVGINISYNFSIDGDIENQSGTYRSATKFEETQFAFTFRNYLDFTKMSPLIQYGLLYVESKTTVPSDDNYRNKLKTTGFGLSFSTHLPSSEKFSWVLSSNLYPRLQHKEDETGINIRSGNSTTNVRFDLEIGGVYKLNRENQILFGVTHTTEKNYFEGTSALTDQSTGLYQTNVSVTNTSTQFSIGYRWSR